MDRSDHDLLICIEQKVKELQGQFTNHLRHHWAITVAALTAAFAGSSSLIVGLILMAVRR